MLELTTDFMAANKGEITSPFTRFYIFLQVIVFFILLAAYYFKYGKEYKTLKSLKAKIKESQEDITRAELNTLFSEEDSQSKYVEQWKKKRS